MPEADPIGMPDGAGGQATRRLIDELIRPILSNPVLDRLEDAAVLALDGGRLAFTTDSFVVRPLVFPGGSIGELAVNGTINDLAMSGATPLALSAALIIEAGFSRAALRRELHALAAAAGRAGVAVVTGDTKVVEHGKADGLFITTTGLGRVAAGVELDVARVQVGDRVLLSGPIGDHGMAILLARAELDLSAEILSDTRPLTAFSAALLGAAGAEVRWMRDATRGGVATVLNELAAGAGVGVQLVDEAIPVRPAVRGACELLGLDPLHVANEGQFLAVVGPGRAAEALAALRATPGGEAATDVGEIVATPAGRVYAVSPYGGRRGVDMLIGDPLPRIC